MINEPNETKIRNIIKEYTNLHEDSDYINDLVEDYINWAEDMFEAYTGWEDEYCDDILEDDFGGNEDVDGACERLWKIYEDGYLNKVSLYEDIKSYIYSLDKNELLYDYVYSYIRELMDLIKEDRGLEECLEEKNFSWDEYINNIIAMFVYDMIDNDARGSVASFLGKYYEDSSDYIDVGDILFNIGYNC